MDIYNILEKEFQIKREYIDNTIKLIDEGNTIPFIARYRKEMTGEMSDVTLRQLNERLTYLRNLESRKEDVTRIIDEQGKLTEELKKNIAKAKTLQEVEDIYAPYKQKKRTRATIAKEKGLEPLADAILAQNISDINAKMIFDAYNQDDEVAKKVIARFKDYLAKGIANIVNTIDPGIIAIGGGVSKSEDIILDGLKEMVRGHLVYKEEEFADIVIATLGNDAGIIGAAILG